MKNNKLYSILPFSITAAVFMFGVGVGHLGNLSSVLAQVPAKTNQVVAAANTMVLNGTFLLQGANGNFDQSNSAGYFKTGTGLVALNGNTTIASGKSFTTSTGTATAVGGAATLNQQAGVVTVDLTGKTTDYTLTITDSMVTTSSLILYNIINVSNTVTACAVQTNTVAGSSGSFQINRSIGSPSPCANPDGTVKVNFVILNPQ